jgi:hypothetical protein
MFCQVEEQVEEREKEEVWESKREAENEGREARVTEGR